MLYSMIGVRYPALIAGLTAKFADLHRVLQRFGWGGLFCDNPVLSIGFR